MTADESPRDEPNPPLSPPPGAHPVASDSAPPVGPAPLSGADASRAEVPPVPEAVVPPAPLPPAPSPYPQSGPYGTTQTSPSGPGAVPAGSAPSGAVPQSPAAYGVVPGQPFGGVPGQPYGVVPGQPFGGVPGQPYGVVPGQPFGGVPGQPYGVAPGQPYGVAPYGYPQQSAPGRLSWALGFLIFVPIPFLNVFVSGIVMAATFSSSARGGPLARTNARGAANWGLTVMLLSTVFLILHFILLAGFAQGSGVTGFYPLGIPITLYLLVLVAHVIVLIVGTVRCSQGKEMSAPFAIPFIR